MRELYLENEETGLNDGELEKGVAEYLTQYQGLKKVLVVPPDFTRCFSYAGELTRMIYRHLSARGVFVQVMPALGTHMEMDAAEKKAFFADVVPEEAMLVHHWQTDTIRLGTVPAEFVSEISGGLFSREIEVEVNHLLFDGGFDLILSVGQVVPHEVVGMSNYSKNLFVGLGGRGMINQSHMLGAVCGLENVIGDADSPVRALYDYAQRNFLDQKAPVAFLQTVTVQDGERVIVKGCYMGESRRPYEKAAALSRKLNITHLDRPVKRVVAYMDPAECKSTWISNKAIYRTCRMIADGGELLVLAPGAASFGENEEADAMIRKYGYCGRDKVLKLYEEGAFGNLSMVAAHLIHGSSNGRYIIRYATDPEKLTEEEVRSVGYEWTDCVEAMRQYGPAVSREGWNTAADGTEYYFAGKPAAGLWQLG
ncbi:MAG: DUF2088 domain-containing protein [Stomatobaculum sp.]|nr:DUF2088 domain-containing protein [Stomatobaculum sp.]